MPVIHAADAVVHELHGSVFTSYAAPARGSAELCAWRLEVPAGSAGVAHTVSREEILLVLSGTLQVTVAGGEGAGTPEPRPAPAPRPAAAKPGDVVLVPAGAQLRLDNPGAEPAAAWVTTSVGLEATLADGSRISPPWVR
jgi:mannose-6-phosphate isomerase-like protein (cupin superfamily)